MSEPAPHPPLPWDQRLRAALVEAARRLVAEGQEPDPERPPTPGVTAPRVRP